MSEEMTSEDSMDEERSSDDSMDEERSSDDSMDDDMASEEMDDDMGSEESMEDESTSEEMDDEMSAMSGYVDHADYTADPGAYGGDGAPVVLFFHADWCPECRATDESLTAEGVPEDLTVVKVDYDEMTDLRQEYGVTQQHTFVQVDGEGEAIHTWTGSRSGEDILAETEG
ncbi:hypothetical protein BJF82_15885 [Kytococcus sp. CUA-901]|nr:hypothetical protein BJF82_15885 [Kytococcus sp. CUA-901]